MPTESMRVAARKETRRDTAAGGVWVWLPPDARVVRWHYEWSGGLNTLKSSGGVVEDARVFTYRDGGHSWDHKKLTGQTGQRWHFNYPSHGAASGVMLRTDPAAWTGGTVAWHGTYECVAVQNVDPTSTATMPVVIRGRIAVSDSAWFGFGWEGNYPSQRHSLLATSEVAHG